MMKISFNLSEACQRPCQFGSRALLAAQIDGLDEIAFRVRMPAFAPCLKRGRE
jgi:hypothetical protein